MHLETDNEAHKNQVRDQIQHRVANAQKTMMGAFFAGIVLAGIATLGLIVTWMSMHSGGH